MGIPTKVVAAPGRLYLIEDIPGKPNIRVRDDQPVNLLQHYTKEEIARANSIMNGVVNGWLIPHAEDMSLPEEKKFGVEIPKGRLVQRTLQTVKLEHVKTDRGTVIKTVLDPEETEAIRRKVAGASAAAKVDGETADAEEMEDGEPIVDKEDSVPTARLEKEKADAARERREGAETTVVTTGDPSKLAKQPTFSIAGFIALSEAEKVEAILTGKISNSKHLKSIKDRKINRGSYFSVRIRSAAGKVLQNMGDA